MNSVLTCVRKKWCAALWEAGSIRTAVTLSIRAIICEWTIRSTESPIARQLRAQTILVDHLECFGKHIARLSTANSWRGVAFYGSPLLLFFGSRMHTLETLHAPIMLAHRKAHALEMWRDNGTRPMPESWSPLAATDRLKTRSQPTLGGVHGAAIGISSSEAERGFKSVLNSFVRSRIRSVRMNRWVALNSD